MHLPIDWDDTPAVCGPGNACQARPLYPHIHLLPTGEYLLCASKCVAIVGMAISCALPYLQFMSACEFDQATKSAAHLLNSAKASGTWLSPRPVNCPGSSKAALDLFITTD